jgi:hypothetical protein
MRALVLLLALGQVWSSTAHAQSRPSTQALTCSQAQAFVASRTSVLMNTGPTTYDTFVSGPIGCSPSSVAELAWVRTRDNPECALQVCRGRSRSGGS